MKQQYFTTTTLALTFVLGVALSGSTSADEATEMAQATPRNCHLQAPKYLTARCEAAPTEQVAMAKFEVVSEEEATKSCYSMPPRYMLYRCE